MRRNPPLPERLVRRRLFLFPFILLSANAWPKTSPKLLWETQFDRLNASADKNRLTGMDWYVQRDFVPPGEIERYTDRICSGPDTAGTSVGTVVDREAGDWNVCIGHDGGGGGDLSDDGHYLEIRAIERDGKVTSARLNSKRTHEFRPSPGTGIRVSARIKVPALDDGGASWPAFWMLQNRIAESPRMGDGDDVPWSCAGAREVDVMEQAPLLGRSTNASTTHWNTDPPPGCRYSTNAGDQVKTDKAFTGRFHVFTLEWEWGRMRFLLDGEQYGRDVPTGEFREPMFFLLNFAVGGALGGAYDPAAPGAVHYEGAGKSLLVDWIRVYSYESGK